MPENYQAKGLQLVNEQLQYDNMDAATKIKYNKYQKDLLVSKDMLEEAWETGLLEGEAKGRAHGKMEGKIEIILKSHALGFDIITISNITGFTEEEIKDILQKK